MNIEILKMHFFTRLLSVLVLLATAHAQSGWSVNCRRQATLCSDKALTSAKCRWVYSSFQLQWIRMDYDNNCYVDSTDLLATLPLYDTNGDNQICMNEWTNRRTQYYKFNKPSQDAIFRTRFPGSDCYSKSAMQKAKAVTIAQYASTQVQELLTWCVENDNLRSSPDCWGLPVMCKEKLRNLDACKAFTRSHNIILTLKEKLKKYQGQFDTDKDGQVTNKEITDEIGNFDKDGNGCITEKGFVNRWTSVYGFSTVFADRRWNEAKGTDTCLNTSDLAKRYTSASGDKFQKALMTDIVKMCESTNSISQYQMNPDCAMVADTCLTYYSTDEMCKWFSDSCGVQNYKNCIQGLKDSNSCDNNNDKKELKMEVKRINNHELEKCLGDDAGNVRQGPLLVGVASLLTSFLLMCRLPLL